MMWFILSIICAVSLSVTDTLCKRALEEESAYLISFIRVFYAMPFLFICSLFIDIPSLDMDFWLSLIILIPLEITALIMYNKAIQISPLSLTIPFQTLTPVFLLFTAFMILGEFPKIFGGFGVLLICIGGYILNIEGSKRRWFEPLLQIVRLKGPVMMIAVAFIYSITSSFGKRAILHSSPLFFAVFYPFVLSLMLFPVVLYKYGFKIKMLVNKPILFLLIGLFSSVMIITHFIAVEMVEVAYMISVKRLSIMFTVLSGTIILKEGRTLDRLIGALLMVLGVTVINLFG